MFTGVYIIFLILLKHRLWVLVKTASPRRIVTTTCTYKLCFEQEYENYQIFFFDFVSFLVVKFSIYFEQACFRNESD